MITLFISCLYVLRLRLKRSACHTFQLKWSNITIVSSVFRKSSLYYVIDSRLRNQNSSTVKTKLISTNGYRTFTPICLNTPTVPAEIKDDRPSSLSSALGMKYPDLEATRMPLVTVKWLLERPQQSGEFGILNIAKTVDQDLILFDRVALAEFK